MRGFYTGSYIYSKTYTQRVYSVTKVELELLVKNGVGMDRETCMKIAAHY